MPRKNPVPERERRVAERLRGIRISSRLSMVAFAGAIGVDTGRYSRYEYGLVPLPYSVGNAICERFDIPQASLAEGSTMTSVPFYIRPSAELQSRIGDKLSFLEAYDKHLKRRIWEVAAELSGNLGRRELLADAARSGRAKAEQFQAMRNELLAVIFDALEIANPEQRIELHDNIVTTLQKFGAANPGVVNLNPGKVTNVTIRREK